MPLELDVAFTPALLSGPARRVCIVIDVLRATSTAVTMLSRGLRELVVAPSVAEARRWAAAHPRYLLCGEQRSLPPAGFDYGNSPSEFARVDLLGQRAVLATTNGTRAFARAAASPVVLAGALLNASVAARAAGREARAQGLGLVLLCAGERRGTSLSLEDAFCAGAIAERVLLHDRSAELSDPAVATLRLYRSYRGSAQAAFRDARHARSLEALGFADDLRCCARTDRFAVVPRLRRGRDGSLRLTLDARSA